MPLQRCCADTSIAVVNQIAIFRGGPDTTIVIGYKITRLSTIAGHLCNFLRDLISDSKEVTSFSQRPNIVIRILSNGIDRIAWTLAVRALDLMESTVLVTHQLAIYSEPNHTAMVLKQRCHILTWQPTSSRQQ